MSGANLDRTNMDRANTLAPAWIGIALAILGASAVALGAFGSHALRNILMPAAMEVWRTAVQYHFWHVLALTVAAMLWTRSRAARVAAFLFVIGIVLFCGSLYALALGAPHWVGAITPIGGLCFIVAWIALGTALIRCAN